MIDYQKIPEQTRMDLVSTFYESAKKAFRDPEYQKAYEKWAEERKQKSK